MTLLKKIALCTIALTLPFSLAAQDADEFDDLDAIFADAEDSDGPVISDVAQTSADEKTQDIHPIVSFFGSLNASLGWVEKIKPEENHSPYGDMASVFGFTARPSDVISIKGSLYTDFPDFEIALYQLYFDYILFGTYYLTAGYYLTSWGNSVIFDTNILDDGSTTIITDDENIEANTIDDDERENILDPDPYTLPKVFSAMLTIPINAGSIQALAVYKEYNDKDDKKQNTWYAASIEYPIFGTSIKLFGRNWADADPRRMNPQAGLEITRDIFDYYFYAHGVAGCPVDNLAIRNIDYAKFVGGVGHKWENPNIAFDVEYQSIYQKSIDDTTHVSHEIALQARWAHLFGTYITPGVKWYHNIKEKKGEVIPGLTISGLPHATLTLGVPILYGGYRDTTYRSLYEDTDEDAAIVIIGAKLSLSVSW